jgi:hypothetical protein
VRAGEREEPQQCVVAVCSTDLARAGRENGLETARGGSAAVMHAAGAHKRAAVHPLTAAGPWKSSRLVRLSGSQALTGGWGARHNPQSTDSH